MDKLDKAIRRITDDWPAEPRWIFTSPDQNKVYRQMRQDVCPEIFKNAKGTPNKQLYSIGGVVVGKDEDYGDKENRAW
jgi:hypothetical protein|tara:strand:- start:4083 stop:4316 length:234 start_codon:yes stop_codon:yes gene_type:complete